MLAALGGRHAPRQAQRSARGACRLHWRTLMHLRSLFAFILLPALAFAQPGTRERGRFSLQGDPATWLALDPPVKHVLIGFNAGSICVFPADQKTVSVYSHPAHK